MSEKFTITKSEMYEFDYERELRTLAFDVAYSMHVELCARRYKMALERVGPGIDKDTAQKFRQTYDNERSSFRYEPKPTPTCSCIPNDTQSEMGCSIHGVAAQLDRTQME